MDYYDTLKLRAAVLSEELVREGFNLADQWFTRTFNIGPGSDRHFFLALRLYTNWKKPIDQKRLHVASRPLVLYTDGRYRYQSIDHRRLLQRIHDSIQRLGLTVVSPTDEWRENTSRSDILNFEFDRLLTVVQVYRQYLLFSSYIRSCMFNPQLFSVHEFSVTNTRIPPSVMPFEYDGVLESWWN
jgi:hypothetical protein